jgi:hypothetical protein
MTRIIADISASLDGFVTSIDRDAPDLRRLPVIR